MARLILFSNYYKASKHNLGRYARYQATRKGVVYPYNTKLNLPSTVRQNELIQSILNDFPNSKELHEYKDYVEKPTIKNASEFITHALEAVPKDDELGKYATYMAERPGAKTIAEHGLFSDKGIPVILAEVERELNVYQGNVWVHIISLRREDAEKLGYNSVARWQNLLSNRRNEIAKEMNISPNNFQWYAAFHDEGHHPHIHMIAYSKNGKQGYVNAQNIRNIKSSLAREIFKVDLYKIYNEQTHYRDNIKVTSKDIIDDIVEDLMKNYSTNPNIQQLLLKLNQRLNNTTGKKIYGYLKPDVKAIVNQIVDEIAEDERVNSLYELWYMQKDLIKKNYIDEPEVRLPLSQNETFRSVNNMVIQEALRLNDLDLLIDDDIIDEPIVYSVNETVPEETDEHIKYKTTPSRKYLKAKRLLDEKSLNFDVEKGVELLIESAEEGNQYAQYRLGKMFLKGLFVDKDVEQGVNWLQKSVAQNNEWAQYFLGKQYLGNEDFERELSRAVILLRQAEKQGNMYAQYTFACQYLFSGEYHSKKTEAIELLKISANQQFVPAMKMLGFIYLKGELIKKNEAKAYELFEHCAEQGDDKAQYALAKILLKSEVVPKDINQAIYWLQQAIKKDNQWAKLLLGKMLLFGIDVPKDETQGIELLTSASKLGNEYATIILEHHKNQANMNMALSSLRMFGYVGNLFRKKLNSDKEKSGIRVDRKLRKQIEEKKIAFGLRLQQ